MRSRIGPKSIREPRHGCASRWASTAAAALCALSFLVRVRGKVGNGVDRDPELGGDVLVRQISRPMRSRVRHSRAVSGRTREMAERLFTAPRLRGERFPFRAARPWTSVPGGRFGPPREYRGRVCGPRSCSPAALSEKRSTPSPTDVTVIPTHASAHDPRADVLSVPAAAGVHHRLLPSANDTGRVSRNRRPRPWRLRGRAAPPRTRRADRSRLPRSAVQIEPHRQHPL